MMRLTALKVERGFQLPDRQLRICGKFSALADTPKECPPLFKFKTYESKIKSRKQKAEFQKIENGFIFAFNFAARDDFVSVLTSPFICSARRDLWLNRSQFFAFAGQNKNLA